MQRLSNKQAGFSLIEIMMALIIISLLIVGVLKTEELITNSKIKRIMQDFEGVRVAHYAYQDRIGTMAGDTDGDRLIDDNDEFWSQMQAEGFLKSSSGATTSQHVFNGAITVGSGEPFEGNSWVCVDLLKTSYALSIEAILDDGDGQAGLFRTSDSTAYPADRDTLVTLCQVL